MLPEIIEIFTPCFRLWGVDKINLMALTFETFVNKNYPQFIFYYISFVEDVL